MSYKINAFTGKFDYYLDPTEAIAHVDLSDMPDSGGTNTDHDLRYFTLSTAQTSITGDKTGTFNLTTTGKVTVGDPTLVAQGIILNDTSYAINATGNSYFNGNIITVGTHDTKLVIDEEVNANASLGYAITLNSQFYLSGTWYDDVTWVKLGLNAIGSPSTGTASFSALTTDDVNSAQVSITSDGYSGSAWPASSPEIDYNINGSRKMVFGYDSNVGRGIFYADTLAGGMYFWDNTQPITSPGLGIALGFDPNVYANNLLFVEPSNIIRITGTVTSPLTCTNLGTFNQLYVNPTTLPSAPASASGAFEYSGDPDYFYSYWDYGYTHTIRVYAYKETTAGKLWSATYAESTPITDATTYSQTYRINWTWDAVAGADGYRVFKTDDYGGFDYNVYADTVTNSYTDDNANSGWPSSGYAATVNWNTSFKATDISFMSYLLINTTSPDAYSSRIVVDGQIGATTFTASGGYKDGNTTLLDYVGGSTLLGSAGNLTMTGARNILAGSQSGQAMTSGQDNFFAGAYSGLANTTGSNNFFMGYYSGGENTVGSNAVYIGSQCGQRSTASGNTYNIAIGSGAYNCGIIGGASGTNNTIIGAWGGCFTTGSSNITIGYYAGHYQTTASNILLIDNQNRTDIAGELAKSLIYGVFNSAVASQTLQINGRVGITLAPTAYLTLPAGSATAGTAPIKFTSGTLTTAAVAGQMEFLTDDFYGTITTGAARKKFVLDDGTALTLTRVPYATTNGRLTDSANLTFDGTTLTTGGFTTTGDVSAGNVNVSAGGKLNIEGSAGDTYFKYNLTVLELWVDGALVAEWE